MTLCIISSRTLPFLTRRSETKLEQEDYEKRPQ